MNRRIKRIVFIVACIVLLVGIIAAIVMGWRSYQQPSDLEVSPTPTQSQSQTMDQQYMRTSTKSWANRAWLSKVNPEKVKSINFVSKRPQIIATSAWVFDGLSCYLNNNTVYVVVGSGVRITGSMNGAFSDLPNLESIAGLELLDTSQVIDMSNLFKNCTSLATIGNYKCLKTDSVLLAEAMFQGCSSLQELDLSDMDLSNAIDMDSIFANCTSLDLLVLPKTQAVQSLSKAFESVGQSASYKTQIQGALYTNNCENMSYMFSGACLYNYDLAQDFNTAKLKNVEGMFYDCNITTIDLSKWDVSQLQTTEKMFWSDSYIKKCNTEGWNVQSLQNCENMFYMCTSLSEITLDWVNVPHIQNAAYLFKNCFYLKTLDVTCFDGIHVGDAREMFANCENLIDLYGEEFQADVSDRMFKNCYNLDGYTEERVDIKMANFDGYFQRRATDSNEPQ